MSDTDTTALAEMLESYLEGADLREIEATTKFHCQKLPPFGIRTYL
jgi:hypothetical protein